MQINQISIRNFKSFGNNEQVLKFDNKTGQLSLLYGRNGAGKTSLISAIEYAIYGKVRGSTKKWSTLSTLPNRINNELMVKVDFDSGPNNILVERGMNPSTLNLYENGLINDRAGKSNIDERIQSYVGIDIETFKSFISMSINDFKNFMSLSTEEKQLLLDKLFNLEVINVLNNILKELVKSNKTLSTKYQSEIDTLNESIESIKKSIQKSIEKEKLNLQAEIDEIRTQMDSKKEEYTSLKEKVEKIKVKEKEIDALLDQEKTKWTELNSDIKGVQKEIDLYNLGKCPTCSTEFIGEQFESLRTTLDDKMKSLLSIKGEIEVNVKSLKEKKQKLTDLSESTGNAFNDLTYLLKNYKSQIDKLTLKKESEKGEDSFDVSEFQNSIKELESKKLTSSESVDVCKEKETYYKEISHIFSEDGVKKSIIASIIKPINRFIDENLKKMGMQFEVRLDETFTASVKSLGNDIEHDTLSTGERKRVNIAILIAYLKLIRTKRSINILFLDEVFASIDLEGVDDILTLLKSFADDYCINIFVVHHAVMNEENFDRILAINKNVFTSITEVKHEELVDSI